jgi:hypothetical protein
MRSAANVTLTSAALAPLVVLPAAALVVPGRLGLLGAAAIWGLGMVLSFAGWGSWLRRRLLPGRQVDWGLRAAWGFGLTVALGGIFCLLGLARRPVLLLWTFAGILLAVWELSSSPAWRRENFSRPGRLFGLGWDTPLFAGLLGAAGLVYLCAAGRVIANPSDDWVAYLPFVKMILKTGTLLDPFSVRRMAAYGGQSYLQALTSLGVEDARLQIFDQGICLILVVGMILGFSREAPSASRFLLALLVLVVLMLPETRINSASEMSGVLGFLALFRSIVLVDRAGLRGLRPALLIALPAAAVCTLRQNYLATVGFMVVAVAFSDGAATPAERRHHLVQVGLLTVACLLPWAALALRSNHTLLFPIFPGNYDPHYAALTAPASWGARFKVYLAAIFGDTPVQLMPLLILATPALARRWHRGALAGLWVGSVVGFAMMAMSLPDADGFTISRYGFGFIVALMIAVGLAASEHLETTPSKPELAVLGAVLIALSVQIQGTRATAVHALEGAIDRMSAPDPNHPPLGSGAEPILRMQQAVPPGERMLVMIERPFLLDYARNRITHLDLPGASSPAPHLPFAAGGQQVSDYLLGQGIRYFAFVRPDQAESQIYSRTHWTSLLTGSMRVWRITAPIFLSTFDDVDELARTRRRLYDDGHFVVVDLQTASTIAAAMSPR